MVFCYVWVGLRGLTNHVFLLEPDSIAGQMQALKSGQPAPKKRKAIKKDDADSDDDSEEDESDTDGEQEHGSDTDTDTDTDDE